MLLAHGFIPPPTPTPWPTYLTYGLAFVVAVLIGVAGFAYVFRSGSRGPTA